MCWGGGVTELQGCGYALGSEWVISEVSSNPTGPILPFQELTTPGLKKAHPPVPHEAANTAVIAGRGCPPPSPHCSPYTAWG